MTSTAAAPAKPVRTRESIERDGSLSPVAKLVIEWLSRQPVGVYRATRIGEALAVPSNEVTEAAYPLRTRGLFAKKDGDRELVLNECRLADDVRALYTKGKA